MYTEIHRMYTNVVACFSCRLKTVMSCFMSFMSSRRTAPALQSDGALSARRASFYRGALGRLSEQLSERLYGRL